MKLLKRKQGKISTAMINTAILSIVLLVVLFQLYASLVPTAQIAGDGLGDEALCGDVSCFYNSSRDTACTANNVTTGDTTACTTVNSVPLGSLFAGTGVIFIIIMAALVIIVTKSFMGKK